MSATVNLSVFQETGTARVQLKYVPVFSPPFSVLTTLQKKRRKKKQMKETASMSIWLTILATPLGVLQPN